MSKFSQRRRFKRLSHLSIAFPKEIARDRNGSCRPAGRPRNERSCDRFPFPVSVSRRKIRPNRSLCRKSLVRCEVRSRRPWYVVIRSRKRRSDVRCSYRTYVSLLEATRKAAACCFRQRASLRAAHSASIQLLRSVGALGDAFLEAGNEPFFFRSQAVHVSRRDVLPHGA